ncbi:MAG: CoA-binding protein [Ignavibacteria bacterium]|nr:CoA-binding protein [Ignavibacteria bacterium]
MSTTQTEIYDFMSQRSLAVVGVSRTGKKFGNTIYKTLKQHGYKVFPLHPEAKTVEGDPCFPSFSALPEKVGGVVICVPPIQTEQVLPQALEAGIKRVWLQQGSESYAAIRYCDKNGISAVHGQCIMMFAEPVGSFHRFHRWVWKLIGKYPSRNADTTSTAH